MNWGAQAACWNDLARGHNLPFVRVPFSERRKRQLRARLSSSPDFWVTLERALSARGSWARENRFPAFDQATRDTIFTRLLEGNYAPTPGDDPGNALEARFAHRRASGHDESKFDGYE